MTYLYACECVRRVLEPNSNYAFRLFVIENNVGDFANGSAFVADLLFNVKQSGRVLLCKLLRQLCI
jgi:hypothetical protein